MKHPEKIFPFVLTILCASLLWFSGCNDDDDGSGGIANEVSLSDDADVSVIETDTTITITYNFVIPARVAGSATINAIVEDLSHGINYTTNPAEASGVITVAFSEGDDSFSFDMVIVDDSDNLPNGNVTFTLASIDGEDATVASGTLKVTIIDNEGESITLDSEEMIVFGEVVPGSPSEAMEITFATLNIVSDFEATATEGFSVGATADGTFGSTATIPASATSIFVKASPLATAAFGASSGMLTFGSGEAEVTVELSAIVSEAIGMLFWVEDFNYAVDDTYPAYGESGENWGIVPVSAHYRLAAQYNGTNPDIVVQSGVSRTGSLDTWYTASRLAGLGMGDNPLNFAGYPGSGVGRTLKLGLDISNHAQRNDCKEEGIYLSKNSVLARRFVEDGNEVTSGNMYFSTMIKVNEVFAEETPVLKNAILMLTGDAAFVNAEAMKLNIRDDGAGGFNFGVSKSADDGSVVYGTTSYGLGATYVVIVKVEIAEDLEGEDPNDAVSVFVYTDGESIPDFEDGSATAEARIDASNQGEDVHDVVNGLELFYLREVADVFNAGGPDNVAVQDVEFSGIRVATSWNALFKDASEAMYDSESEDQLQTLKYGRASCTSGPGPKLGQQDI